MQSRSCDDASRPVLEPGLARVDDFPPNPTLFPLMKRAATDVVPPFDQARLNRLKG